MQASFVLSFLYKFVLDQFIYYRWMYSDQDSLAISEAPYLLSVVGWFLLSILASKSGMDELLGLEVSYWMFGIGVSQSISRLMPPSPAESDVRPAST